ncbi:hypothetical protein [Aeromonas veronii]|uniref:hypothetical protein n=1 Tax=Aeromonas veronii TaxID=654 RepID=UPI0024467725|nr:hypothetical protein [Aeromonas veronii]
MSKEKWKHWIFLYEHIKKVILYFPENPKFIMFFLIFILITGAGVWIPWAFKIDLTSVCVLRGESDDVRQALGTVCLYVKGMDVAFFQNFSVFMFNLGVLGTIATEFFFKGETDSSLSDRKDLKEISALFLWVVAFVLSFDSLKNPTGFSWYVALGALLTLFLWICININKEQYKMKPDPKNVTAENKDFTLPGSGLDEVNASNAPLKGEGLQ